MNGNVEIDVVVPAYNAGRYIECCLASVIAQTVRVQQVIVVDDGSTDDTCAKVRAFAMRTDIEIRLVSQLNAGPSAARNKGLSLTRGDYIALLDADDVWLPTKLEKQLSLFASNPRLGVAYCDYGLITEYGHEIENKGFKLDRTVRGSVQEKLLHGNLIAGSASAVLIKKRCLDETGLFDERLVCAEDWDLWLRLAKRHEFDYVDEILVQLRQHEGNSQKNELRMLGGELLFLNKLFINGQMRWFHFMQLSQRLILNKIAPQTLAGFSDCCPQIQQALTGWRRMALAAVVRPLAVVRHCYRLTRKRLAD